MVESSINIKSLYSQCHQGFFKVPYLLYLPSQFWNIFVNWSLLLYSNRCLQCVIIDIFKVFIEWCLWWKKLMEVQTVAFGSANALKPKTENINLKVMVLAIGFSASAFGAFDPLFFFFFGTFSCLVYLDIFLPNFSPRFLGFPSLALGLDSFPLPATELLA